MKNSASYTENKQLKKKVIEKSLKVLRFESMHHAAFALFILCMFATVNVGLALILFLLPLVHVIIVYMLSKPVSLEVKGIVNELETVRADVILRKINSASSQAFSFPFFKMIGVSEDTHSNLTSKNEYFRDLALGEIAHEIGHLNQYDRLVTYWLATSTFILSLIGLVLITIQVISLILFGSFLEFELYGPTGVFLFTLFGFMVFTFSRVVHQREYIADLYGVSSLGDKFFSFLQNGKMIDECSRSQKSILEKLTLAVNKFSHPPFSNRIKITSGEYLFSGSHMRSLGLQWSLIITLFTIGMFKLGMSKFIVGELLILIVQLALLSFSFYRAYCLSKNFKDAIHYFTSYSAGIISGVMLISVVYYFMMKLNEIGKNIELNPPYHVYGLLSFTVLSSFLLFFILKYALRRQGFSLINKEKFGKYTIKIVNLPVDLFLIFFVKAAVLLTTDAIYSQDLNVDALDISKTWCLLIAGVIASPFFVAIIDSQIFKVCTHKLNLKTIAFWLLAISFVLSFNVNVYSLLMLPVKAPEIAEILYGLSVFQQLHHILISNPIDMIFWVIVWGVIRRD
ncbi:M48 family metalloprotease [Alteromonas sp. a30]|uniref:M48 family metalloprotease n=1 Tax=Alteromonas sp. a30 TaxID=2730917 RepID=UPI00227E1A81|nr:M48 family metalloprotease [Alteromonas sp. a30]MCY7297296.1 M48 family metalloprotease [Alteromonas sp. a30]